MTWEEFDKAVDILAQKIRDSGVKINTIYGKPRGGLVLAVKLSHIFNVPLITQLGLRNETLVVDDIIDSGQSMVRTKLTASLYYNPKSIYKPMFYVYEKDCDWVIFPWENQKI